MSQKEVLFELMFPNSTFDHTSSSSLSFSQQKNERKMAAEEIVNLIFPLTNDQTLVEVQNSDMYL